jgi:hypothetical protein
MALPLSTAKQLSRGKGQAKVVSEYEGKRSPKRTKPFNGATDRFRSTKKKK